MTQSELTYAEQVVQQERTRLANVRKFLTNLSTRNTEGLASVSAAILENGISVEGALQRLKTSPSELRQIAEDLVKTQEARIASAETRLIEANRHFRAEKHVIAEDNAKLAAMFADAPASEAERATERRKEHQAKQARIQRAMETTHQA